MKWHTEIRKISELKNWDINPRKISQEKYDELSYNVETLGSFEPLVADVDGTVISGNQRLKIAQELGQEEVEVSIPERKLTPAERKKIGVIANTHSGEFDFETLGDEFESTLRELGLEDLIPEEKGEVEDDNYEEPEELETRVELGEVWQLGRHRLICGDSTTIEVVDKLMNGQKAAMCFTDPPYNMGYKGGEGKRRKEILNDNMTSDEFYTFLKNSCRRIMENTIGGTYICMGVAELGKLKMAFEDSGGHWQDNIIWVKDNFTLGGSDYQHIYEPILYGWPQKTKDHYFINVRDNSNVWEDLRNVKTEYKDGYTTISFQGFKVKVQGKITEGEVIRKKQKTDIWRYSKPTKSVEHPTMKPIQLCVTAIRNSSRKGEIVLDLFGGSGSTLIAAEKTGRICYMSELDPHYATVIIDRWEKLTDQKAKKL